MEETPIQVNMLGEFCVSFGDITLGDRNSRSRNVKTLLAYLLYHRKRMASIEELIGILGSGQKNETPVASLRTALYRVRRTLKPIAERLKAPLIVVQNGMYGWNPQVAVTLDVEDFEMRCQSDVPESADPEEYCREVLDLYRGDFLSSLAAERWVEPLAEYYRRLYISAVEDTAPLLIGHGQAREAIGYCRIAARMAPYHEPLYRWQICAHALLGDEEGAKAAYEELRALLYEDLGVMPGEEIQKVYQDMVMNTQGKTLTPDSIRSQLRECSPASGAFLCDYMSFKLFYQAEARAAARRGDAVHIGLLSIQGRDGKSLSPRVLARAMEQLRAQIGKSLRTGDIASCCSSSQYILMLVQANYENSQLVCERITQAFFRSHPRSPIRIQSVVFPLEPLLEV